MTGTWITEAEATNPTYWAKHLRQTVRFAEGLAELLKEPDLILLEVGPGRTLSTFAKRHPLYINHAMLRSLRHPREEQSDMAFLLTTLGQFWLAGGAIDWAGFYAHQRRHRLPLPTYPFERQRYWIEAPSEPSSSQIVPSTAVPHPQTRSGSAWRSQTRPGSRQAQKLGSGQRIEGDPSQQAQSMPRPIDDWFYIPSWTHQLLPPHGIKAFRGRFLVGGTEGGG